MIPSTTVLASYKVAGGGGGGGGGGVSASISSRTVEDFAFGGNTAQATYQLNSNGNVYNHDNTNLETWLDSGVNSNFESRASGLTGDALASGTLNTWQALSTTRSWRLDAAGGEEKSCTFTVEIRNASTLAVLTTATISLNSTSTA